MIEWHEKGKSRDDKDFAEQEREDEKDPNELKIWESWRKFNEEDPDTMEVTTKWKTAYGYHEGR